MIKLLISCLVFILFAIGILSTCKKNETSNKELKLSDFCGQSAVAHKKGYCGVHCYLIFEKQGILTEVDVSENAYLVYKDGRPVKCK